MQTQRQPVIFFRIVADIAIVLLSFGGAFLIFPKDDISKLLQHARYIIPSAMIFWYIFAKMNGLHTEFRSRNFTYELIGIIKSVLFLTLSLIVLIFIQKEIYLTRKFVLVYSCFVLTGVVAERVLLRMFFAKARLRGRNIRNMLIIGAGEVGKAFSESIKMNPQFGYRLMGFLDDNTKPFLNGKYLGKIDDLDNVLFRNQIDDVIIALPNYAAERIDTIIKTCEQHTTLVKIIPDYFRFTSGKYEITIFDKFPVISVRNDSINYMHSRLFKRLFDLIFSLTLFLLVFSWLWPLLAVIIKVTSPGPVFFVQERWGRRNKKIRCYKFRSMRADSKDVNDKGEYQQATKDDPRITKIGKFIRKTNLDELPQFWNVIKGELSIVGPRPHPIPLNMASRKVIPGYMQRALVKPGITGWAQVNGYRGETKDPEAMQGRVEHDLWYIENWSFWLDIQIIAMTVINMLRGEKNAY